ncbi:MAG: acetate kinase [Rhizobacter sp.]|nr:acetate kinase [Rhizobacter sp.]
MTLASFAPVAFAADADADLDALNQRINEHNLRLNELRRSLEREEASLRQIRRALTEQQQAQRGGAGGTTTPGAVDLSVPQQADAGAPMTVGQAPDTRRPPPVAQIFEEAGVLTPKGTLVLEPSIQYGYSTNNRVTLLGYTVIPSLLIGLVDVREVQRNTFTAAITARYGITNRFEVEARVPYLYRSDTTKSREIFTGTAVDNVIGASGRDIGDIELAARYQFNDGGSDMPYFIGSLRFKTRTGTDPFEVVTDCVTRCVGNTTGTGQPLTLPTGSGFYSLQTGLTWLYPTDPAVLFGSFTYLHNFKRDVTRTVLNGEKESLGEIAPGGVLGFNIGMGLSLNDKSSFSVGYDHASVARTKQNGVTVPGSVRTQIGTLLFGYSYRLSSQRTLSFSLGSGVTADAPDVTLSMRMPFSF